MPLYKNAFFEILICQNFKIWKIQIQGLFKDFKGLSRTYSVFKDFQGTGIFVSKIQGLLKDPMNPENRHHRCDRQHVVGEDCSVTPERPRLMNLLHRSAGGVVLLSLWSWSIHWLLGRPGRSCQSCSWR